MRRFKFCAMKRDDRAGLRNTTGLNRPGNTSRSFFLSANDEPSWIRPVCLQTRDRREEQAVRRDGAEVIGGQRTRERRGPGRRRAAGGATERLAIAADAHGA